MLYMFYVRYLLVFNETVATRVSLETHFSMLIFWTCLSSAETELWSIQSLSIDLCNSSTLIQYLCQTLEPVCFSFSKKNRPATTNFLSSFHMLSSLRKMRNL